MTNVSDGEPPFDWTILDRVAAGDASSEDHRQLNAWVAEDPSREALLSEWTALQEGLATPSASWDTAPVLERISAYATTRNARTKRNLWHGALSRMTSPSARVWLASGCAAGIAFLVALAVRPHAAPDLGTTRTYVTTTGQQATLSLTDGTRVTLAPRTTIRLVGFGRNARTVELDGQAHFEVAHQGTVPFVVRSGAATIRVLGTEFGVRDYPGESRVRVSVTSGKVLATSSSRRSELTLTAGHVAEVSDSTVIMKSGDDLVTETAWVHGKLIFRNAPLPQVLHALSNWYGYEFRVTDSLLARQNITIGVSTHSPTDALTVLEHVLQVSLTISGDTVTLTPMRARPAGGTPRARTYDVWTPNREVGR